MNFGNLLEGFSFKSIQTEVLYHKWPPFYVSVFKLFGKHVFHLICLLYGGMNKGWVQVKAVAIN